MDKDTISMRKKPSFVSDACPLRVHHNNIVNILIYCIYGIYSSLISIVCTPASREGRRERGDRTHRIRLQIHPRLSSQWSRPLVVHLISEAAAAVTVGWPGTKAAGAMQALCCCCRRIKVQDGRTARRAHDLHRRLPRQSD